LQSTYDSVYQVKVLDIDGNPYQDRAFKFTFSQSECPTNYCSTNHVLFKTKMIRKDHVSVIDKEINIFVDPMNPNTDKNKNKNEKNVDPTTTDATVPNNT